MTTPKRFIPATSLDGGTSIGSSYMRAYASCPYSFFNTYLRPVGETDSGAPLVGVQPQYRRPAFGFGTMFHTFLEHLYLSGCRDGADTGEWDVDFAREATKVVAATQQSGYQDDSQYHKDLEEVLLLGMYYMDRYGPGTLNPDWPQRQVAFDGDGEPLIEREFSLSLGYGDYYVTSKPDILLTDNGYLMTDDHKTAGRGWGARRANNIDTDPQFTMEHMILRDLFPGELISGSGVNIVVKGLVSTSKAQRFYRNRTTRSSLDITFFKSDCISLLQQIDDAVGNFRELWAKSGDLEVAASLAFPRHGQRTDQCHAFNSTCDFIDLCVYKDRIGNNLRAFKPRRVEQPGHEETDEQ